jgi:uncharacterized protein (TIRG00374 family)
MPSRRGRTSAPLVRICVSLFAVLLLILLFYRLGPDNILSLFRRMGWKFFGVVLIFGIQEVVRALALVECLSQETCPGLRKLVHIRVIGEGIRAVTLTGPLLSEPARAWLIRREGVSSSEAVAAAVAEYAANSFSTAFLTIWGALYLVAYLHPPQELRVASFVFLGGAAGYLLLAFVLLYCRARVAGAVAAKIVALTGLQARASGFLEGIRRTEDAMLLILRDRPATLVRIAAYEFIAQLLLLMETYWALISMGVATSPLMASIAEILTKLANIAFAGAAEGAYVLLFLALGLPAAAGFALSLVKRMRSLAFALIGLGILALLPNRPSRPALATKIGPQ